ncbi:MAG: c-type cytochrome [Alphaproteobacteria bacterium]
MRSLLWKLFLLFLAADTQGAIAQDVEAGHRLASTWCSGCHHVEYSATGPQRDSAPPFVSVAARASTTAASLNVFLSTPHSVMPDFSLSRQEIANLTAYILSLRSSERQKN